MTARLRLIPCSEPGCSLIHGISVVPALPKGRSEQALAGGQVSRHASTPSGARERSHESTGGPPARRTSPDRVAADDRGSPSARPAAGVALASPAAGDPPLSPDDHRIDQSGGPEACWLWTGERSTDGYGRADLNGRTKHTRAHRAVYAFVHGDIPDGLFVLHSCDERLCCNPSHLRTGTSADNVRDMFDRNRQPAHLRPRSACGRGHRLEGDNARPRAGGGRRCRACQAIYDKNRRSRQSHLAAGVVPTSPAATSLRSGSRAGHRHPGVAGQREGLTALRVSGIRSGA